MAKADFHGFLKKVSGKLGGIVVRKIRGKYYLSPVPLPRRAKRKPTEGQRAFRERFALASAYARAVQQDAARRAFYEPMARARDLRIRAVAIGDWFNPPQITDVDLRKYRGRAGDPIRIKATDDAGVVRVTVALRDEAGQSLESGEAQLERATWAYRAKTAAPRDQRLTIQVVAADHPGNKAHRTETWPAKP